MQTVSHEHLNAAIKILQNNIARQPVVAAKGREMTFSDHAHTSNLSTVSGKVRQTISQQGPIAATSCVTDIAIDGSGLVAVSSSADDAASQISFTRGGSFQRNQHGNLVNVDGDKLLAFAMNEAGSALEKTVSIASLQPVNINNTISTAVATTEVDLEANLNAGNLPLPGEQGSIKLLGINAGNTETSIIRADDKALGSLKYGDIFAVQVNNNPATKYQFQLGGVSASYDVSKTPIYGAPNATTTFNFNVAGTPTPSPDRLNEGEILEVTVNGKSYDLTAESTVGGAALPPAKAFHNLTALSAALTAINGGNDLIAEIKDNQLYIALKNPEGSLSFSGRVNNKNIKDKLGLNDIVTNNNPDVRRFNSLKSLRDIAGPYSNKTITAEVTLGANSRLNFSATGATDSLQISTIRGARIVDEPAWGGDGTVRGRSSIFIKSTQHGLAAGDHVWLENIGSGHSGGTYMVTEVTNNNQFVVGIRDACNLLPAAAPAALGAATQLRSDVSWQQVPGQVYNPDSVENILYVADSTSFTISVSAAATYIKGDCVYFSGLEPDCDSSRIPAGYYKITSKHRLILTLARIDNTIFGSTTLGSPAAGVASRATGVPRPTPGATIRKVGTVAPGTVAPGTVAPGAVLVIDYDRKFLTTQTGSSLVTVYTSLHHQYQTGDNFRFEGLEPPLIVGGLTIDTTQPHVIHSVNVAEGSITFDNALTTSITPTALAAVSAETIGVKNTLLKGATNPQLSFSDKILSYLGLNPKVKNFKPTYNASDSDLSLSGPTNSKKGLFSQPIVVIDSLGNEHTITARFAKLSTNLWATEIFGSQKPNGDFDFITSRHDGQISAGTLSFNSDGTFSGANGDVGNEIKVNWNNGSQVSKVKINWQQVAGKNGAKGVTQTNLPSTFLSLAPNGHTAGDLSSITIDDQGFVCGLFSNGEARNLYQIPLATVANFDGLQSAAGGTYKTTAESGRVFLRFAGIGGNAKIKSKALEGSNINVFDCLMKIQEHASSQQIGFRLLAIDRKSIEVALAETRS